MWGHGQAGAGGEEHCCAAQALPEKCRVLSLERLATWASEASCVLYGRLLSLQALMLLYFLLNGCFLKDNLFKVLLTGFQLLFITLVFHSKNFSLNIESILRTWERGFFYSCCIFVRGVYSPNSFPKPLSSVHWENPSELVKNGTGLFCSNSKVLLHAPSLCLGNLLINSTVVTGDLNILG